MNGTKVICVPMKLFANEPWFLLSHFGTKHVIRCISSSQPKMVKDPSDHRSQEIVLEGNVKWKPRDTTKLDISLVPPLGPAKKLPRY